MRRNTAADFWAKVDVRGPDECWPWIARSKIRGGYGQLAFAGRRGLSAHRLAYELTTGEDPGDFSVCHHCDNPPCCNPAHLFLGTVTDNARDAAAKGRVAWGERCFQSKLTAVDVVAMRVRYAAGETKAELSRAFDVTPTNVRFIVERKTWARL